MRHYVSILAVSIVGGALLAAACSSTKDDPGIVDMGDAGGASSSGGPAVTDDGLNTTGVGAGTGAATGLPCDVQQILENYCIGCHLATTKYPLLTYNDLLKPAPSDPTKTMAIRSLERITAGEMPPKPAVPLDPDEFAAFKSWVNVNMPRNDEACTTAPPPAADAGAATGPTTCTSKTFWQGADDNASELMHPGGACITCHTQKGGPAFKAAGTVYPTAHEPNDCNGVTTPVTIVITDAKGKVTTMDTNAAGNFFTRSKITAPFKAKVVSGAKERAMNGTVSAGDCNSCHTEKGANGAPGRIMAP